MNRHRLAEARSLAYHRAVAEMLPARPELLDRARERAASWSRSEARSAGLARRWLDILARPLPEIRAFLVDTGEEAAELRQATPFAGAIEPKERWRIWREVREEWESGGQP